MKRPSEPIDARQQILSRVRAATAHEPGPTAITFPQPSPLAEDAVARFMTEASAVAADVLDLRALGLDAMTQTLQQLIATKAALDPDGLVATWLPSCPTTTLAEAWAAPTEAVAVLRADHGIAASGSIVLDRGQRPRDDVVCEASVYVLATERIVPHLSALPPLEAGCRIIVTGPSRTADIEKRLVMGAHGPSGVTILLVDGSVLGR